jgi:hypothetical protein
MKSFTLFYILYRDIFNFHILFHSILNILKIIFLSFLLVLVFLYFVFEIGSHYVAQIGMVLASLQSAGITGI